MEPHGETRGRFYAAGPVLASIRDDVRGERAPIGNPYPELMAQIRAGRVTPQTPLF